MPADRQSKNTQATPCRSGPADALHGYGFGFWEWWPSKNQVYCSPHVYRLLRLPDDSQSPWKKLLKAIDAPDRRRVINALQLPNLPSTVSFKRRHDGVSLVLRAECIARDRHGHHITGLLESATLRKRTPDMMDDSGELYKWDRDTRMADIGLWRYRIGDASMQLSKTLSDRIGYSSGADLPLETYLHYLHPEDREALKRHIQNGIQKNTVVDVIYRTRHSPPVWLHQRGHGIGPPGAETQTLFGIMQDITHQKSLENALYASEQKYRVLLEHSSEAVLHLDTDGRVVGSNPAGCSVFGLAPSEIIGKTITKLAGEANTATTAGIWRRVLEHGHARLDRLHIPHPSGESIAVALSAHRMQWEGKKFIQAIIRDMSEIKSDEIERQTRERRQRDTLVKEVHHRIKNNLQGIVGLLRETAYAHPQLQTPIDKAVGQISTMALIHGLSGYQSGLYLYDLTEAIVNNITKLSNSPVVFKAGIRYTTQITEDEAVPIALIINELVTNAAKHARPARVDVVMEKEPRTTAIAIHIINSADVTPVHFDFIGRSGLGKGLDLVNSLLPGTGAKLEYSGHDGKIHCRLTLSPPVLVDTPS